MYDTPEQQHMWESLSTVNEDSRRYVLALVSSMCVNETGLRFFEAAGVPVIDTGLYCSNQSSVYADRIHLGYIDAMVVWCVSVVSAN